MRQLAADIVLIEDGKILLELRDAEPFKGMWVIPGGRIGENETIEQCAIREAKEETNLDVTLVSSNKKLMKSNFAEELILPAALLEENIPTFKKQKAHQHIDFNYFGMGL